MPSTTNFGWTTPADTDLVKDGASAIRTLGNGIDTTLVDLKGGTTGQVLSKNSNTDMDFTWVAQDDSNAIQNTIVDAKGDLITATAADTPARLAIGANGTFLKANSSTATGLEWGSVTGGQLTETQFTSSNASWSIPTGVTGIWALVVGGGGGGGASSTAAASTGGGAGGAGQVVEKFFTVSGDTTLNITVGAGGAGGTTSGARGGTGSTSSIVGNTSATTYVSAAGGGGGGGGIAANVSGLTGASGGGNGSATNRTLGGGGGFESPATNNGRFFGTQWANDVAPTTGGVTGYAGGDGNGGLEYGGRGIRIWGRNLAAGGIGAEDTGSFGINFGASCKAPVNTNATNATANTGSGAAGGQSNTTTKYNGGNGGSGLVVLRYVV